MSTKYEGKFGRVPSESQLDLAIFYYNQEPHTPKLITETWRVVFNYWTTDAITRGVRLPQIDVPALETTIDVAEQPVRDVEGNLIPTTMIFYPLEFQGKEGLKLLGEMFRAMKSRTIEKSTPVLNENDQAGWINVEGTLESPNTDTDENLLTRHFNLLNRQGMNENQYVLLSQFMKLIRSKYIDLKTLCRLLGSRIDNRVINARFGHNGDLHVNTHIWPSLHGWELGGRSIKVIQET